MRRTDRLSRMRKIKPSLCLISQVQALSTPDLPGSDRVGVHGAPGARVDPRTGALYRSPLRLDALADALDALRQSGG